MKSFSSKHESARLERLRSFDVLDTPPDEDFDRVARMAAKVFGVPMAAVSLVDEYRRWFKASCGLRHQEADRELSFCGQTILSDKVLVVRDALKHRRFAKNPLVQEQGVRFYAGAPLRTSDGYRLGALCIMDRAPRTFTAAERRTLADLATMVMDKLTLRHTADDLRTEVERRKRGQQELAKQHRLLQRLSGAQEDRIRERTADLTAEMERRGQIERDRVNLMGVVEESPDFIALSTLDCRPIYINQAGLRLIGLDRVPTAPDATVCQYLHPDDAAFINQAVLPTLHVEGHWGGDFRFRHLVTGEIIPVSGNLFLIRDPATGEPVSLAAIARDITERKRAEAALSESQERFRHLVEQAREAFFICNLDGHIIDVNQEACESLGYAREELIGLPVTAVETTFEPTEALPRWQSWQRGQGTTTQGLHRRKDGTAFPVEARISIVHTDGNRYVLALVRDMTDRHRAEAALNQAKEEAEKANRAKSEFLSRMSHELRTPLNAILGFGQILLSQAATTTQTEGATHVLNAGRHLLSLINEVLDIARIEAGRVELSPEPVRVADLVAAALDLVGPQAHERRVTFDVGWQEGGDYHLLADPQRIKQVLLNLLSNAVKYSPESGRVRVTCHEVRPRGLRVCVTDSGPGISPDKLARLFVPFDRLGAERSSVPGTGLGLALSKHLVEAMGGTIGTDTRAGEGSTFWFQLPRTRPRAVAAEYRPLLPALAATTSLPLPALAAPAVKELGLPQYTVLYIEDNASNLSLVEHLLAHRPQVRLLTARTGEEGLAAARRHRPQLVLLDLHLPDLPGWDVLTRLQANRRTRGIPVVAVSADATPDTVERLLKAGARSYLTKPLDIDRFYQILPGLSLRRETGTLPNPTLN